MTAINYGVLIGPLQKSYCASKTSSVKQLVIAQSQLCTTHHLAVTKHPVKLTQLYLTHPRPVMILMWHVI